MQVSSAVSTEGTGLEGLRLQPRDRVLVLGRYGAGHVGDEAILAGLMAQMPPVARVRVVSRSPRETAALHGVGAVSPARALLALLRTDALIVGGGNLKCAGAGGMVRSISLFCRIALARGVRVAFHGVGIYPGAPPSVLRSVASLAPRLASLTVRDRASARTLESMGIAYRRVPDLSMSMLERPPSVASAILKEIGVHGDRPVVGLCLAAETSEEDRLESAIPALADRLPDVQFCFLPLSHHPTGRGQNDLLLARKLKVLSSRIAVLEASLHPAEVLAVFRAFSAAVCTHYHGFLFAHRAGVPIIPLPCGEECLDWADEHGLRPVEPLKAPLLLALNAALTTNGSAKRAGAPGPLAHRFAVSTSQSAGSL